MIAVSIPLSPCRIPPSEIGAILRDVKWFRCLLVLLLCAMLPLSGLAASGLAGDCPMQMTSMSGDPHGEMAASMDHCDGMSTPSGSKVKGPFCKIAAQCNLGSLYHPSATPEVARAASVERKTDFTYTDSLRSRAPDGLWRPPTSL